MTGCAAAAAAYPEPCATIDPAVHDHAVAQRLARGGAWTIRRIAFATGLSRHDVRQSLTRLEAIPDGPALAPFWTIPATR